MLVERTKCPMCTSSRFSILFSMHYHDKAMKQYLKNYYSENIDPYLKELEKFDYLIKIRVADIQHYQRFLGGKLAAIEGISQTHTYVVIEDVKSETARQIGV